MHDCDVHGAGWRLVAWLLTLALCGALPTAAGARPVVAITAPTDQAAVSGETWIQVAYRSDSARPIVRLELHLDGQAVQEYVLPTPLLEGRKSFAEDMGRRAPGLHTFSVRALDAAGEAGQAQVTVTVQGAAQPIADRIPPVISIYYPAQGAIVSGRVTIRAEASDNVAVRNVVFLIDGKLHTLLINRPPFTANWDTTTYREGPHILEARVKDAADNEGLSAAVTVIVQNSAPAPVSAGPTGFSGGAPVGLAPAVAPGPFAGAGGPAPGARGPAPVAPVVIEPSVSAAGGPAGPGTAVVVAAPGPGAALPPGAPRAPGGAIPGPGEGITPRVVPAGPEPEVSVAGGTGGPEPDVGEGGAPAAPGPPGGEVGPGTGGVIAQPPAAPHDVEPPRVPAPAPRPPAELAVPETAFAEPRAPAYDIVSVAASPDLAVPSSGRMATPSAVLPTAPKDETGEEAVKEAPAEAAPAGVEPGVGGEPPDTSAAVALPGVSDLKSEGSGPVGGPVELYHEGPRVAAPGGRIEGNAGGGKPVEGPAGPVEKPVDKPEVPPGPIVEKPGDAPGVVEQSVENGPNTAKPARPAAGGARPHSGLRRLKPDGAAAVSAVRGAEGGTELRDLAVTDAGSLESASVLFRGKLLGEEARPEVRDGVLMISLKHVFEAADGALYWFSAEKRARAVTASADLAVQIGKTRAVLNGETRELAAAPVLKDGRILVPLDVVADALALRFGYDPKRQQVVVSDR